MFSILQDPDSVKVTSKIAKTHFSNDNQTNFQRLIRIRKIVAKFTATFMLHRTSSLPSQV